MPAPAEIASAYRLNASCFGTRAIESKQRSWKATVKGCYEACVKISEGQTTQENVRWCSERRVLPNCCHNQYVSSHCHWWQNGDDNWSGKCYCVVRGTVVSCRSVDAAKAQRTRRRKITCVFVHSSLSYGEETMLLLSSLINSTVKGEFQLFILEVQLSRSLIFLKVFQDALTKRWNV